MEMYELEVLLEKYKYIANSSYLKYNFIIEFHNKFGGNFKLDFTLKDKIKKNHKYPLKTYIYNNLCIKANNKSIKKPYFLTSNILYFLISDEFTSDIELLLIKRIDNESSIFNGLIINLDSYECVCYPIKSMLISKNSNIKKFNNDEILYEYDIYKLYDGIEISLYYYNKKWNISGFDKININNICYDKHKSKMINKFNEIILKNIILKKIELDNINYGSYLDKMFKDNNFIDIKKKILDEIEYENLINDINIDNILLNFYNNLDKKYTYNFILINKNYNLCNKKDKIKFFCKINNKESVYYDTLFKNISIKKINYMDSREVENGIILLSKNNNENRVIYYNNYYSLNKYLYSHIKRNIFDINMILLQNILIYKISKNIFNDIFHKYKNIYNLIIKKIDYLVDYIYEYIINKQMQNYIPYSDISKDKDDININEQIKENFVNIIIKFLKKNKYLNDMLFINNNMSICQNDENKCVLSEYEVLKFKEMYYHNKDLYKSLIRDYLYSKEIINDLYLYIFNY